MKTTKLKLYTSFICGILLLPNLSFAYFTTGQSATRLTSDTILYTVSYKFGFAERGLYMPIGSVRDSEDKTDYLEYQILDDDEETEIGTSNSIVLTSSKEVEIKDNQYYLQSGESAEFTLITLLKVPEDEQTSKSDLSLIVSSLPFTMIVEGSAFAGNLNPSELQYYRTPEIDI